MTNFLAHCLLLGKKKPAVTHFIILKMQGYGKVFFRMIKLIIRYLKNYVIHNIKPVHTEKNNIYRNNVWRLVLMHNHQAMDGGAIIQTDIFLHALAVKKNEYILVV